MCIFIFSLLASATAARFSSNAFPLICTEITHNMTVDCCAGIKYVDCDEKTKVCNVEYDRHNCKMEKPNLECDDPSNCRVYITIEQTKAVHPLLVLTVIIIMVLICMACPDAFVLGLIISSFSPDSDKETFHDC